MRILILNWRDPKNPRAGGAETVTFKYAQYWAKKGHSVTWICNFFPGSTPREISTGIEFVRVGPALGYTVLELIFTYPLFLVSAIMAAFSEFHRNKIDLVIDEIHGLPFFTPFFSQARNVLWVCEVAGPIWDRMYPTPINLIGRMLETLLYKYVYRHTEIWAISQATRADILNINPAALVKVIPLGIDPVPDPKIKKTFFPSAVFLARLVKMKGVEVALQATKEIAARLPDFKLFLIGSGSGGYLYSLRQMVRELGISNNVEFLGRLSEPEKYKVLAKSHFLIHPSYKEGFGLTVLEAGLVGTPTVARAGSSMDELIKHGGSGLIFQKESQIPDLFVNWIWGRKYSLLSSNIKKTASRYFWSKVLSKSRLP